MENEIRVSINIPLHILSRVLCAMEQDECLDKIVAFSLAGYVMRREEASMKLEKPNEKVKAED